MEECERFIMGYASAFEKSSIYASEEEITFMLEIVVDILLTVFVVKLIFIREIGERCSGTGYNVTKCEILIPKIMPALALRVMIRIVGSRGASSSVSLFSPRTFHWTSARN
jgi:hypothetical protein